MVSFRALAGLNSPKYKRRLYRVTNVPGRGGILIHSGNTTKDIVGCILLGEEYGMLHGQLAIKKSRAACARFEAHAKEKPFLLHVYWEEGA